MSNPAPVAGDAFGYSVAIDGNLAVVGAAYDDAGAVDAGSAYIYNVATGALLHTLNNPTPVAGDLFGFAVSIEGNNVVVSASYDDTDTAGAGAVYIYDATTGGLLSTINNPILGDDGFGWDVSIQGGYVGAALDDTSGANSGSIYIYDLTSGNLLHTIVNPTPLAGDSFGVRVEVDNNYIVTGALSDDTGAANAGSAYVYRVDFGDADVIYGGAGDDIMFGLFGDDILFGQGGSDTLSGGAGADRFVFEAATVFGAVDTIQDFNQIEEDVIDISNVLTGYTRGVSNILDFVQFVDVGGDTTMEIDADGLVGGVNFQAAALIIGGAGLDETTLETLGQIDGTI